MSRPVGGMQTNSIEPPTAVSAIEVWSTHKATRVNTHRIPMVLVIDLCDDLVFSCTTVILQLVINIIRGRLSQRYVEHEFQIIVDLPRQIVQSFMQNHALGYILERMGIDINVGSRWLNLRF